MSQALYRKWRPQSWEAVIGQDHVTHTLRNALAAERVAHAYLFSGPRGTGKTTTARLLAKAVNCLAEDQRARPCGECDPCQAVNAGRFLDLIEIDAASNTSVEDVRDLRDKINFSPNQGRYKVYIIDEVHMLSTAAFNALLKTLEEPPPHAIFILATTEMHKIPATVLSRCQRHEFRRIPNPDIVRLLAKLAADEGIVVDEPALTLIARQATGAMRDAISLLDQLASTGKPITLASAQELLGAATSQAVIDLIEALQAGDAAAGLNCLHATLDAGVDPRQYARQVVEYLRSLLLIRLNNPGLVDATAEMRATMARQALAFGEGDLLRVLRLFNFAANDGRSAWQPSLPLELALVEALHAGPNTADASAETAAAPQPTRPARRPAAPTGRAAPAPADDLPSVDDGSGLSVALVQSHWSKLLGQVNERDKAAAALLRSGRVVGVRSGTIFFGLSEVLRPKLEKPETMQLIVDLLTQLLNLPVGFRCMVDTGKAASLPPDVDQEGMVAAATRDLGGELVDVNK